MKKQELIHYHSLLNELKKSVENQTGEDIDTSEYESLDVSPVSIHAGKSQHEDAVFALSEALADVAVSDSHIEAIPQ